MDTLKEKLDALEQAAQAMSQAMYEQDIQAEKMNDETSEDDNVVDAEFEEKTE